MKRYSSKQERRGDGRLLFWKQSSDVRQGYHKLLKIFPPKQFPNATLCAAEFRVNYTPEEWADLREDLLKCYKDGEAAHFEVKNGRVELCVPSDKFTAEWERMEYGVRTVFDGDENVYQPFDTVSTPTLSTDEPF